EPNFFPIDRNVGKFDPRPRRESRSKSRRYGHRNSILFDRKKISISLFGKFESLASRSSPPAVGQPINMPLCVERVGFREHTGGDWSLNIFKSNQGDGSRIIPGEGAVSE